MGLQAILGISTGLEEIIYLQWARGPKLNKNKFSLFFSFLSEFIMGHFIVVHLYIGTIYNMLWSIYDDLQGPLLMFMNQ